MSIVINVASMDDDDSLCDNDDECESSVDVLGRESDECVDDDDDDESDAYAACACVCASCVCVCNSCTLILHSHTTQHNQQHNIKYKKKTILCGC